ncbi:MAG: glycosyltransferase [Cyclobacteriaceae bacterium]
MHKLGILDKFYTSGYAGSFLQKISEKIPSNPLQRRYIHDLPAGKVHANWFFEFRENWIRQVEKNPVKAREAVYQRDINFDTYMARTIKKLETTHYWGFQGSCHDSLIASKESGKKSICELATAHVTSAKEILGSEKNLHPDWAFTIDNLVFPAPYERRLEEEPHHADHVIAASTFTKATLLAQDIPAEKIKVVPLGFDIAHIPYEPDTFPPYQSRPLRLLYAGRVTQRKGIYYLLEALKSFPVNQVELHIIGQMNGAEALLKPYQSFIHYHGAMTQQAIFNAYKDYDVLVLPSLFEGFGLVIVEAMAAGLPVITTPNTIGPELIKQNDNGIIVPIRDIAALKSSIEFFVNLDSDKLHQMRLLARKSATQYSWSHYQERLAKLLPQL